MDRPGAVKTSWLPEEDLLAYPESYVQTPERHPMEYLAAILHDRRLSGGRIGVEMDNYYYSARADAVLQARLGNATFVDATGLVNWLRALKSEKELEYMRIAGRSSLQRIAGHSKSLSPESPRIVLWPNSSTH